MEQRITAKPAGKSSSLRGAVPRRLEDSPAGLETLDIIPTACTTSEDRVAARTVLVELAGSLTHRGERS